MTTVSMDNTAAEKFFLTSFAWCVFTINPMPACDRSHLPHCRPKAGTQRYGGQSRWSR